MFVRVIEISTIVLFIIMMITQVIVPLWKNRPIFPIFNRSRRDLESSLTALQELEDQQKLAADLRKRTKTLLKNEEN